MNDPGLDEPAQQAAEDIEENVYEADKEKAEAEEQDFLDPRHVALLAITLMFKLKRSVAGGSLRPPAL